MGKGRESEWLVTVGQPCNGISRKAQGGDEAVNGCVNNGEYC